MVLLRSLFDLGDSLMKASLWGNLEAVKPFLAAAADSKAQDYDHRTAQMIAEEMARPKSQSY